MAKKSAKAPAKKQAPAKKAAVAKKPNGSKAKPVAKSTAKPAPKSAAKPAAKPAPKPAAKALLGGKKADEPSPAAKPAKTLRLVKSEEPAAVETAAEVEAAPVPVAKPARAVPTSGRVLSAVKTEKARPTKRAAKTEKVNAGDEEAKWAEYHERYKGERAPVYDMKATFEAGSPLQHKLLGWGWVLSCENDRLEVLFKDGRRILISNYNPGR